MSPFLQLLLGQQAGPEVAQGQIDVVGQRGGSENSTGPSYNDYALNNVPAVRARQADVKETEEASQRKGMFGVKGTLRDILGLVGDAFLVQGGRNPVYAPQREKERISDAFAGFTEDPIAAAERVANYDPDAGYGLFKDAQASQLAQGKLRSDRATEQRQGFDDATKRISQTYAALMQNPTPKGAAYALQLARNESETLGIPLAQLGVTENMTNDVMRILAGRGATVSQTNNLPLTERRLAVSEGQLGVAKQRLQVAFGTLKDREARTKLAEQVLGLKRDDQQFDQMMDLMDLSLDVEKQNSKESSGRRTVPSASPSASRFRPASN